MSNIGNAVDMPHLYQEVVGAKLVSGGCMQVSLANGQTITCDAKACIRTGHRVLIDHLWRGSQQMLVVRQDCSVEPEVVFWRFAQLTGPSDSGEIPVPCA